MKKSELILLLLRVVLGAVFLVSGFAKLMQPYQNFEASVTAYGLLSGPAATLAARLLPWLEFYGGLFLVLGLWIRQAVLLLWALNGLFIIVLAQALIRKLPVQDCGCFGKAGLLTPAQTLTLDLVLWVGFAGLWVFRKAADFLSLDRSMPDA